MDKFKKGHLYGDGWHTQFLYLVLDDNGMAVRFIPRYSEYYIYDGRIDLISEDLHEIDDGFWLFWSLSPQIASDVWRLCLVLSNQIPSKGTLRDMDGMLKHVRARQEESLQCSHMFYADDFDLLGSFFFKDGKVQYSSYEREDMIFEKILGMTCTRERTT